MTNNLLTSFKHYLSTLPLGSISRKLYSADVARFLSFLGGDPTLSQVKNPASYSRYLAHLRAHASTPSLLRRTTASLRQFGTFLTVTHSLPNPTLTLFSPSQTSATNPQTLSDKYIKLFTDYLNSLHLSPLTIKSYKSDITRYLDHCHSHLHSTHIVELLTSKNRRKYLKYLAESKLASPATIERKDQSLARFTQWYHKVYSPSIVPDNKLIDSPTHLTPISPQKTLAHTPPSSPSPEKIKSRVKKINYRIPLVPFLGSPSVRNFATLLILLIFTATLAIFGYRQFSRDATLTAAYPSTPISPNRQLSFQGRLENSSGTPITSATNMVFKLFTASSGGTELYSTGTCSIDPDTDGVFSTQIGSTCGSAITSSVFTENADVWLEVTIGAETLSPRQQIATVAYALNAETLQGFPLSSTVSAVRNTVVPMNQWGEVILGEQSPRLTGVSGTLAISAPALSITTATGTNGNISLAPDGTGQVNVTGNTTTTNFFNVSNAQLTSGSLITGTAANDNTGFNLIDLFSGASPTSKFSVNDAGNVTLAGDLTVSGTNATLPNDSISPNEVLTTGQTDEYCLTYEATGSTWEWQTCGSGGGMTSFTLSGDSGSDQTISDGNILEIAGGTGITTSAGATDRVTVNFASTELNDLTWGTGANASITWSSALSGATDPTLAFGNDLISVGGDLAVNGATSADITSSTTTATLFNSTVTNLSLGGAASTLAIGPAGSGAGTITLAGGSGDTGCTIDDSNGNLTCSGSISGGSITATAIPFSGITSATNTSAAMVVGTGASLGFTGSGTIDASTLLSGTWAIPGTIGSTTPNTATFTTLSSNGNTTLGDAITDTLTFTARVAQDSDLIPIGTTGTNDLGSSTLPWDNAYLTNLDYTAGAGTLTLKDNTASAFKIVEGANTYLDITTTDNAESFSLNLPAGGVTSHTANLFTANIAQTINLGTGTAADTINIGTGGTTADDINIGGLTTSHTDFTGVVNFAGATTYYVDASGNAKFNDLIVADTGNPGLTIGNGTNAQMLLGETTLTDNNTTFTIDTPYAALTIADDLAISGGNITTATTFDSSATVTGAFTANGDVTLGDAITDTITFNGRVAQDADLIPIGTTGTNDLGSSTLPWDNVYSGATYFGGGTTYYVNSSGTGNLNGLTLAGALDANGDVSIADTNIAFDGASTTFTTTGAFTLTPGGAVLIGDGGDTLQINSSDWDISATGDMTNIGAITADGTLTVSNTASISGTLTVGNGTTNTIRPAYGPLTFDAKTGADTWTTAMTVDDITGYVGIGTTSPSQALDVTGSNLIVQNTSGNVSAIVSGAAGTARFLLFQTSGSNRWGLRASNTAESGGGSNSGSDFTIYRFDDSGTYLGTAMSITRSSGNTDINGQLNIDLNEGAATEAVCSNANDTAGGGVNALLYDCSGTPSADYAEMYPTQNNVSYGDIVSPTSDIAMVKRTENTTIIDNEFVPTPKLGKTSIPYQSEVIGIVSNNYGDFSSTGHGIVDDQDHPLPVALNGRVPVKISRNSPPIQVGDPITSSTDPGRGTKATRSGQIVGMALQTWDPNHPTDTILVFVRNTYHLVMDQSGNVDLPTLATTELKTNLISPLSPDQPIKVEAPVVIKSVSDSTPELTVEGEIVADSISARTAKLDSLEVKNIVVDRLTANHIEGLDAKIATLSAHTTTELSDSDLESITTRIKDRLSSLTATDSGSASDLPTPPEATESAIPLVPSDQLPSTASDSATLISLDADFVTINQYLAVIGSATITSLTVNQDIFVDKITSQTGTLALQPTGGVINLANSTLIVDSTGSVAVNGALSVTGALALYPDSTSPLGKLLQVFDEQGLEVASIDASGSATLADVTTQLITIASGGVATPSALATEATSNATAGESILASPNTELTINSPYVTGQTLVYLTPTANTDNKVLFVKSKTEGSFTVGIDSPASSDIPFNWWIIRLE